MLIGGTAACTPPSKPNEASHAPPAASSVEGSGVEPLPPLPLTPEAERAVKEVIGDTRVVLLGESSHGAGNAFAWRAAIVEVLRRDLGFEHLVVESSFYDCRRAWREAERHQDPIRVGRECAFDIWSEAVEADPLWRSVTDGRMQLWGMDPQLSGDVAGWLADELDALAGALLPKHDTASSELLRRTLAATRNDNIIRTPEERRAGAALLRSLKRQLVARPGDWDPPSENRGFWLHTVDSIIATEEDYWLYQLSNGTIDAAQHNLRERQMAWNLRWILKQVAPEERVVVWLHTGHAARNLHEVGLVDHGDHTHDFSSSVTLGGLLTDAIEPDPLVIATVSTEGRWSLAGKGRNGQLPAQPAGGLGDRRRAEGIDRALIDLRVAPRRFPWLAEPLAAPVIGMESTTATWPRHVDVLLFEREMTPATTRPGAVAIGPDK